MPEKKGTFYGFGSYFGGAGDASNKNDTKKKNNNSSKQDISLKSPKKSPKKSPSETKNIFHGIGGTFPQKSNEPAGPSRAYPPPLPGQQSYQQYQKQQQQQQHHRQIITNDRYAQNVPAPAAKGPFSGSNSKSQPSSQQPPLGKGQNGLFAPPMSGNNKPAYSTANVAPNSTNHNTNPSSFAAAWSNNGRGKDPAPERGGLFSTHNNAFTSQSSRGMDRSAGGQSSKAVDPYQKQPPLRDERPPRPGEAAPRNPSGRPDKTPAAPLSLGNMGRERSDSAAAESSKRGGLFKWDRSKEPEEVASTSRAPVGTNLSGKASDNKFAAAFGRGTPTGREAMQQEKQRAIVPDPKAPLQRPQPKDMRLQAEKESDADKLAASNASLASRWRKGKDENNDKKPTLDTPTSRDLKNGPVGTQDRLKDKMFHGLQAPPARKQEQPPPSSQAESHRAEMSLKDDPRHKVNERPKDSAPPTKNQIKHDPTALNNLKSRNERVNDESQQSKDQRSFFDRIRNGSGPNVTDGIPQQDKRAGESSRRDEPTGRKEMAVDNSRNIDPRSASDAANSRFERQDHRTGKGFFETLPTSREVKKNGYPTSSAAAPIPPTRSNGEPVAASSQKEGGPKGAFWRNKAGEELGPTKPTQSRDIESPDAAKRQVPTAPFAPDLSKSTKPTNADHAHGWSSSFNTQGSRATKQAEGPGSQRPERGATEVAKPKLTASALNRLEDNGKQARPYDKLNIDATKSADPIRTRDPRDDGRPAGTKPKPYEVPPFSGPSSSQAKNEKVSAKTLPSRSPLDFLGRRDRKEPFTSQEGLQLSDARKEVPQESTTDPMGKKKLRDLMNKPLVVQQPRDTRNAIPDTTAHNDIQKPSSRVVAGDLTSSSPANVTSSKKDLPFTKEQPSLPRDDRQKTPFESKSNKKQESLERAVPDFSASSKPDKRELRQGLDGPQSAKTEAKQSNVATSDKKHGLRDRFAPFRGQNDKLPQDITSQPPTIPDRSLPTGPNWEMRREPERPEVPQISASNVTKDRSLPSESSKRPEKAWNGNPVQIERSRDAAEPNLFSSTKREVNDDRHANQKREQGQALPPSQGLARAEPATFPKPPGLGSEARSSRSREEKPSSERTPWKQVLLPGRTDKGVVDANLPTSSTSEQIKRSDASERSDRGKADLQSSLPPVKGLTSQPRDPRPPFTSTKDDGLSEDKNKPEKLHGLFRRKGLGSDEVRRHPVDAADVDGLFADQTRKDSHRPTQSDVNKPVDTKTIDMRKAEVPRDAQRDPPTAADQPSSTNLRDATTGRKRTQFDAKDRGDESSLPIKASSSQAPKTSHAGEPAVMSSFEPARVPQVDASRETADDALNSKRGEGFNAPRNLKDKMHPFGSRYAEGKLDKDSRTVPAKEAITSSRDAQLTGAALDDLNISSKPETKKQNAEPNVSLRDQDRRRGGEQVVLPTDESNDKGISSRLGLFRHKKEDRRHESGHRNQPSGSKIDATREDPRRATPSSADDAVSSRKDRSVPPSDETYPASVFDSEISSKSANTQPISRSGKLPDKAVASVVPPKSDAPKSSFKNAVKEDEWPRPAGIQPLAKDIRKVFGTENLAPFQTGEVQPVSAGSVVDETKPRPVPDDWLKSPGIVASNVSSTSQPAGPQQTQKKGWWKNLWGEETSDGKLKPANNSSTLRVPDKTVAGAVPMALQPGAGNSIPESTQANKSLPLQRDLSQVDNIGSAEPALPRLGEQGAIGLPAINRTEPEESSRRRFPQFSETVGKDEKRSIESMATPSAKDLSVGPSEEDTSKAGKSKYLPFSRRDAQPDQPFMAPTAGKFNDVEAVSSSNKPQVPRSPELPGAMDVNLVSMPVDPVDDFKGPRSKSRNRKSSIYGLKAPVLPQSHEPMPDTMFSDVHSQSQTDKSMPPVPAASKKSEAVDGNLDDGVSVFGQQFGSDRGEFSVDNKKKSGRSSPSLEGSNHFSLFNRREPKPASKELRDPMASKFRGLEPAEYGQDIMPNDTMAPQSKEPFASEFSSRNTRAMNNKTSGTMSEDAVFQRGIAPEPSTNFSTTMPFDQVNEPTNLSEQGASPSLYDTKKSEPRYMSQMPAPLNLKSSRPKRKQGFEDANTISAAPVSKEIDFTTNMPVATDRSKDLNDTFANPAFASPPYSAHNAVFDQFSPDTSKAAPAVSPQESDARNVPETKTKDNFGGWFKSKPKGLSDLDDQVDVNSQRNFDHNEVHNFPGANSTFQNQFEMNHEQQLDSQRGETQPSGFENNSKSFWSSSDRKKDKKFAFGDSSQVSSKPLSHLDANDPFVNEDTQIDAQSSAIMVDETKPSVLSRFRSKTNDKEGSLSHRDVDLLQDKQRNEFAAGAWSPPHNSRDQVATESANDFPSPPYMSTGLGSTIIEDAQAFRHIDEPAFATAEHTFAADRYPSYGALPDSSLSMEDGRPGNSIATSEKEGSRLRGLFGKKRHDKDFPPIMQDSDSVPTSKEPRLWDHEAQMEDRSRSIDAFNDRGIEESGHDDMSVFDRKTSENEKHLGGPRTSPRSFARDISLPGFDDENNFHTSSKLSFEDYTQPHTGAHDSVAEPTIVSAAYQPISPPVQPHLENKDSTFSPQFADMSKNDFGYENMSRGTESTFDNTARNKDVDQRSTSPSAKSKLASLFTKKPKDKSTRANDNVQFDPDRDLEYETNEMPEEMSGALFNDDAVSTQDAGMTGRQASDDKLDTLESTSSPTTRPDLKYTSTRYGGGKKSTGQYDFGDALGDHSPADQALLDDPFSHSQAAYEQSLPEAPVFASDAPGKKREMPSLNDDAYNHADSFEPNGSSTAFKSDETVHESFRPDMSVQSPSYPLSSGEPYMSEPVVHDRAVSNSEWQHHDTSQPGLQDDSFSQSLDAKDDTRWDSNFSLHDKQSPSHFVVGNDTSLSPREEVNSSFAATAAFEPLSTSSSPRQSEEPFSTRRSIDYTASDEAQSGSAMPADGKAGLGSKLRNWLKKSDNKDGDKDDVLKYSSATRRTDRDAEYSTADIPDREIEKGKLYRILAELIPEAYGLAADAPLSSSRPSSVLNSPLHEDDALAHDNGRIESFEDKAAYGQDFTSSRRQSTGKSRKMEKFLLAGIG